MDLPALKSRVKQLLSLPLPQGDDYDIYNVSVARAHELLQGAITLMSAVHGPESNQAKLLRELPINEKNWSPKNIINSVRGVLQNLSDELESGLAGSLQLRMTGEVLTDFVRLAKEILNEREEAAKNIAAVLTAAAYEDTIRRMGETLAAVTERLPLSEIILNPARFKEF